MNETYSPVTEYIIENSPLYQGRTVDYITDVVKKYLESEGILKFGTYKGFEMTRLLDIEICWDTENDEIRLKLFDGLHAATLRIDYLTFIHSVEPDNMIIYMFKKLFTEYEERFQMQTADHLTQSIIKDYYTFNSYRIKVDLND